MTLLKNMSKNLLDTNLIIRFLVNDDSEKVKKVEDLLRNTDNTNILPDTIIAEIIWVLSSYYYLQKSEITEKIKALIHVESVDCNAVLINKALSLWEENNISYVDSYLAAIAELGNITLLSYDRNLKYVSSITVREP